MRSGEIEKPFDSRLKETLAAVARSDEVFERWLGQRGIDREKLLEVVRMVRLTHPKEFNEAIAVFERSLGEESADCGSPDQKSVGYEEMNLLSGGAIKV